MARLHLSAELVQQIVLAARIWTAVMLVLGLGLGTVALVLGLRGLALAKNSRPKSWRTAKFTFNFRRLEWIIFQDPRSLFTYSWHPWPFVSTRKKTGFHYLIFYRKPLHYGMALVLVLALALSVLALLTSLLDRPSAICFMEADRHTDVGRTHVPNIAVLAYFCLSNAMYSIG